MRFDRGINLSIAAFHIPPEPHGEHDLRCDQRGRADWTGLRHADGAARGNTRQLHL